MKKTVNISLVFLTFLLVAGGRKHAENKRLHFDIPQGWPQTVYDFTKNPLTENGFALGKQLFYDPILSRDSTISCASCHLQFTGFTHIDHNVSHGIEGKKGTRNTLALVNLAWSKNFQWDGGVNNIEVQPLSPITNPVEMDSRMDEVVKKIGRQVTYQKMFAAAFGDETVTGQRVLKALSQYTLSLISHHSKYDKYMRHEKGGEMTEQELNGLRLFRKNCASCHTEPLFTNQQFASNGLPIDPDYKDAGRYAITRNPADSLRFKVPTLRNIEFTYPYMHDGRFTKLKEVIQHYTNGIEHNKTLSPELKDPVVMTANEKVDLLAFLLTLTDREFLYDQRYRYLPK